MIQDYNGNVIDRGEKQVRRKERRKTFKQTILHASGNLKGDTEPPVLTQTRSNHITAA